MMAQNHDQFRLEEPILILGESTEAQANRGALGLWLDEIHIDSEPRDLKIIEDFLHSEEFLDVFNSLQKYPNNIIKDLLALKDHDAVSADFIHTLSALELKQKYADAKNKSLNKEVTPPPFATPVMVEAPPFPDQRAQILADIRATIKSSKINVTSIEEIPKKKPMTVNNTELVNYELINKVKKSILVLSTSLLIATTVHSSAH